MNGVFAAITMALSVGLTGAIVEWIARQTHESRLFMIALGRERNDADNARATRLRIVNAVVTFIGIAAVLIDAGSAVAIWAAILCPTISVVHLCIESVATLRSVKLELIPGRFQVSLDERPGLKELISVPLQVVNVLCLLIPVAVFAWIVDRLPESVPMHWDMHGSVNRYGNPSELWMMAGIIAFDIVLLWVLVAAMAKERWALPVERAEEYAALQLKSRRTMIRLIEWIMTAVNVPSAIIWLAVSAMWFPDYQHLGEPAIMVAVTVMMIGCLVPLVVYGKSLIKVRDRLRAIAGTEVLGTHPDGWRWGGTVYYAPDDPAVFVPKRIGIGQTVNFARPMAWVFLIGVIVLPLAIGLVALAAAN